MTFDVKKTLFAFKEAVTPVRVFNVKSVYYEYFSGLKKVKKSKKH